MDEYDELVDRLSESGFTIYVYGSYAKGSHIRGVSDLDAIVFLEDLTEGLKIAYSIPPIPRLRLDLRALKPGCMGIPKLHAFLAIRYGELISGNPIDLRLSPEEVYKLAREAAHKELRDMFRNIYSDNPERDKLYDLSDNLLTIAILYLISKGYYDVTKPEVIHYDDVIPKDQMRIIRKAYNVKYAYVIKVNSIELLKAAEKIVDHM